MMAKFMRISRVTYGLSCLPNPLSWGLLAEGSLDTTTIICIDGEPVRVWIAAEVMTNAMYENGLPKRVVSICIYPLLEEDRDRWCEMDVKMSSPPTGRNLISAWLLCHVD